MLMSNLSIPRMLLQLVLLLLALVSVPWMLLPKPFLLKKQHQDVSRGFFLFWFSVKCVYVTVCIYGFLLQIISFRGTKVKITNYSRAQMIRFKQRQIMVLMVMRSLNSVKFLFINSFTLLSSYSEQFQTQLLTFVYGP